MLYLVSKAKQVFSGTTGGVLWVQTILVFLTLLSSSEVVTESWSMLIRLADLSVPVSWMEMPPTKAGEGLGGGRLNRHIAACVPTLPVS